MARAVAAFDLPTRTGTLFTGTAEQTEKIAQEAIDEGRVVLPGIQALFGFQLIAVCNERFIQLSEGEQLVHFTAIMLVAIAIALIMCKARDGRPLPRASARRVL